MPLDAVALGAIAHELNDMLAGAKIEKIHQPERDEILLIIKSSCGAKKLVMSADEIKADMKQKNMKQKDYFCHVGYWNEYIDYLKKEINNRYGK